MQQFLIKSKDYECEPYLKFKHNIKLQLCDYQGSPVKGTDFWVTLDVIKENDKVIIHFPVINFQTGQYANNPSEQAPVGISGGYLITVDGYLPYFIRPTEIVSCSSMGCSDSGTSLPASYAQPLNTYPTPVSGYILQITIQGGIVIQGAGTFGNIIPEGPQILLPTNVTYIVKPRYALSMNFNVSLKKTNVANFTNPIVKSLGLGVTHVNDSYNGVFVFAWADNSMEKDKTNGILNLMVAIGKIRKDGSFYISKPKQLTKFTTNNTLIFDTSVAINRTNPKNIVISYSYGVTENEYPNTIISYACRAVTFDGGKTWPDEFNGYNGVKQLSEYGVGNNRGVLADKFGNFWYLSTYLLQPINQETDDQIGNIPYIMLSTDQGKTFNVIYILQPVPYDQYTYDVPEFCIGSGGSGNYGLQFIVDFVNVSNTNEFGNIYPIVGFLPVTGLGTYGNFNVTALQNLYNIIEFPGIASSSDGKVWYLGINDTSTANFNSISQKIIFKAPGEIGQNIAGPWDVGYTSLIADIYGSGTQSSLPGSYMLNIARDILYDDNRKALYAIINFQKLDINIDKKKTQNMQLYLIISRNNGQTWSPAIELSTSSIGNRGYASMSLENTTRSLIIGWYDGRHGEPKLESLEYYGTIIPGWILDEITAKLQASNPMYFNEQQSITV